MAPVFIMLPPRGRLKASLSVAFKGGLFLHKMQVLLLHLNPRRDRGFLSPPWTAHKVQQLFLHLVKRLPTIAANSVFATVTVLWR